MGAPDCTDYLFNGKVIVCMDLKSQVPGGPDLQKKITEVSGGTSAIISNKYKRSGEGT